jgi:hypothetical protein
MARLRGMAKACIDCSAYLPVPLEELTEFGICLNDETFEPFVEDLLVGSIPASCQALVEQKKFVGDCSVCPDFRESEIIEIDDESPLGHELRRLGESGQLTPESLENAIIEEGLRRTDWKTLPVDQYAKQLESGRSKERDAGISSLGAMIALGNPAAFQALLQYLSSLAPPRTTKDVHLKKEILRQLACWKDRSVVAPVLIQELGRIPSNNTTRQWISDILKFIERCPLEVVQDPLERMLSDKKFSFKLMRKVKEALLR